MLFTKYRHCLCVFGSVASAVAFSLTVQHPATEMDEMAMDDYVLMARVQVCGGLR